MKIIHKHDALDVSKPEGTNVTYYLFDEYEVHYNEQVPESIQTWHHHEKIWESLYIIEDVPSIYNAYQQQRLKMTQRAS